ncbi:CPBP family intramembrane glutamic endopeptidase [Burkholderia sp. LMU1-1-1.1]|uniref:CPBP family intramembrane glutamic endopeptidase n=1 Tax=Burkholderia sp. LMU1-1-1.1 TaxID=3135266 RepID=UPI003447BAB8
MMRQPTAARAIWLMAKMRLTRQANQIMASAMFNRFKKKKPRDGIATKRGNMWILTLVMALLFSFSFGSLARTVIVNMQCRLVEASACQSVNKQGQRHVDVEIAAAELHAAPFDPTLLNGLTMELTILFAVAVLLPLGSKEMAQPDWDLEWLVTLPIKRSTLLWGRLLERSASNSAGIVALTAPYVMIAWYSGFKWTALPIALLAAALLLPLAALLHTLADTGLRMWLPASQLRNLQAVASLFNMPLVYLVMALGMPRADGFAMQWAAGFPSWMIWTPPGVVLQAIQAQTLAQFASAATLLLAQLAVLLWSGVALMRYQLRNGVVGSSSRESTRGKAAAKPPAGALSAIGSLLSTIQRRELLLLSRDRNFLVQTLLLPVIIVGSQVVFNGTLNSMGELGQHHTVAAAIAFGIGVYVLMLSAFQTLNNEGHVLWLLYTVPRSMESVLKEKAKLWGVLAMTYPLIVLVFTAMHTDVWDWRAPVLALTVLAGIPIYSMIAVSLGVFACDPTAVEVRTRVRPTYAYLYMLLASFYTWSIYSDNWAQKLITMVLTASFALALWQKARDALPYLLDPAAAPPARVSTSDGLIAATAFFVMQGILVLVLADDAKAPGLDVITLSFGLSGLVVYALVRLIYWRSKTANVPVIWRGIQLGASLRDAAVAIAVSCVVAFSYLYALKHSSLAAQLPALPPAVDTRLWLFALTVLAAPLCEEFIFRGLIFGGLRRSMPAAQAIVISAAVFAAVHPALSLLPVFVVGLCTAWVYERSKTLLAPMLVHAAYNAAMVAIQL